MPVKGHECAGFFIFRESKFSEVPFLDPTFPRPAVKSAQRRGSSLFSSLSVKNLQEEE
jgi:hypothetical protein